MGKWLYLMGSVPFLVLGAVHILYSVMDHFRPRKVVPFKPEVIAAMKGSTLRLTKATTVWRAWIGFNISHGIGVFFFGFVFLVMTLSDFAGLKAITPLFYAAPVLAILYLTLSIKYWFRIPAIGSGIGAVCFLAGLALAL